MNQNQDYFDFKHIGALYAVTLKVNRRVYGGEKRKKALDTGPKKKKKN